MDQFMNEMAVWNGMSSAFISNAIFFAACAFLIWVGFRFTSRIYYEGNVNLLGKIFTTLFCLSIALFTLGTMAQGQGTGKVEPPPKPVGTRPRTSATIKSKS